MLRLLLSVDGQTDFDDNDVTGVGVLLLLVGLYLSSAVLGSKC